MKLKALAAFLTCLLARSAVAETLRFGQILCPDKRYDCIEVQKGDTWESLWEDDYERVLVKKVNRMNVRLREGMTLAVPKRLSKATVESLSPFPKKIEANGGKKIVVDLSILAWAAYGPDGRFVNWGPASGGKKWCPDVHGRCRTPDGEFSVGSKGGPKCRSHKFPVPKGGAPMPYCMFFRGGYALHGSHEVPGYNASHGCVRMFPEDAEWLNWFFVEIPAKDNDDSVTQVLILPYSDPALLE